MYRGLRLQVPAMIADGASFGACRVVSRGEQERERERERRRSFCGGRPVPSLARMPDGGNWKPISTGHAGARWLLRNQCSIPFDGFV